MAERLQEALPGAKVIEGLNLVAMESFDASPDLSSVGLHRQSRYHE